MMDGVIKGLFKVKQPHQLQFVRYNNKINVTRPRPPHFERALVETLCLPYFSLVKKQKHIPDFESCKGPEQLQFTFDEDHPYVKILAENSRKIFFESKLIAFFHFNAITPEEQFEAKLLAKKNGTKLVLQNKHALRKGLTGTPFETVLSLFESPTAMLYGPEPDIQKLMYIQKKLPKYPLMAAIVENRLLSYSELQRYSSLKNVTDSRLNLVSVLSSASQHLVQQLNSHPNNLVGLLNQRKKLLEDGES